jgi:hypothetical protein
MNRVRRLFAVVAVLMLVASFALPAFGDELPSGGQYLNLLNGGYAVSAGSDIIYANLTKGKGVFVMDGNGENHTLLVDVAEPRFLSVVGNDLYFYSFYDYWNKKGSIQKYDSVSGKTTVIRDSIYVSLMVVDTNASKIRVNSADSRGFAVAYEMNLDGSGFIDTDKLLETKAVKANSRGVVYRDSTDINMYWFQSINDYESWGNYRRVDDVVSYGMDDGYLYVSHHQNPFTDKDAIIRYQLTGASSGETILSSKFGYNFQVVNGWLFYLDGYITNGMYGSLGSTARPTIYMMKPDGSMRQILE